MTTIVKTSIESVHGSKHRLLFYRCLDDQGTVHKYGPVITADPELDPASLLKQVARRVQESLDAAARRKTTEKEAGELAAVLIAGKFDKATSPELAKLLAESLTTTLVQAKDAPELAKLLKEVEDEAKKPGGVKP
jgi:hypothetical protein